jgi:hypothetical protein
LVAGIARSVSWKALWSQETRISFRSSGR